MFISFALLVVVVGRLGLPFVKDSNLRKKKHGQKGTKE